MAAGRSLTITLQPKVLAKVEEIAALEHRPLEALIDEAVDRYVEQRGTANLDRDTFLARLQEHGRRISIQSEDDVERMSDEWRREQRHTA